MKRSNLRRKTPLRRAKLGSLPKPLRRTRLRRENPERAKQTRAYNKRVKEWKLEHPDCEACVSIYRYLGLPMPDLHPTKDCHHAARRHGKLLMDEKWWRAVCRWAHNWIRDNANAARELNLLAPKKM